MTMTTMMMRSTFRPVVVVTLTLVLLSSPVESRRWTDIATYHSLGQGEKGGNGQQTISMLLSASLIEEIDPLFNSAAPTFQPTDMPSPIPTTNTPSTLPSISPSLSKEPSSEPSGQPTTAEPSPKPTAKPSTAAPTVDPFPYNPAPHSPPRGYFNYDQSPTAKYGPGQPKEVRHNATTNRIEFFNNGWRHRWQAPANWYWHEFDNRQYSKPSDTYYGWIAFRNPANWNFCQSVGLQSPVDATANGAFCFEYHQIRTTAGDIRYHQLRPVIESNKLRIIIPRRPCLNVDSGLDKSNPACNSPRPPGADLAHWWSNKADATHMDLKIPSEHLLEGKRYDMELQIWHVHIFKRRCPVMSLMVQATPGGYNYRFQRLLNLWQDVWNKDLSKCRNRRLEMTSKGMELLEDMVDPDDYLHHVERFTYKNETEEAEEARDLQADWFNPYHEDMLKTIYFLGYDGSLTEPPCGQWVSWRIMDVPFEVSYTQLFQAKNLIFNHVDHTCRRTGVHTPAPEYSVARPLQDTFKRPIHKCSKLDYVSDEMKRLWVSQGKSPQVPGHLWQRE